MTISCVVQNNRSRYQVDDLITKIEKKLWRFSWNIQHFKSKFSGSKCTRLWSKKELSKFFLKKNENDHFPFHIYIGVVKNRVYELCVKLSSTVQRGKCDTFFFLLRGKFFWFSKNKNWWKIQLVKSGSTKYKLIRDLQSSSAKSRSRKNKHVFRTFICMRKSALKKIGVCRCIILK